MYQVNMHDEHKLSTAFAVSLRSSHPEIPSADQHSEGSEDMRALGG